MNRGRRGVWNPSYLLKLSTMALPHDAEMTSAVPLDTILTGAPRATSGPSSTVCDGAIDVVNGISPPPATVMLGGILAVEGWTAVSASAGIAPDETFVTLSSADGRRLYVKARTMPRVDVKQHFLHPDMPDAGFTAFVDVSKLRGEYGLGLSRVYKGQLEHCQFSVPLRISE